MIQCSDESRIQWRLKYITSLRHKLESTDTDGSLTMHLCLILTQWMDTGTVVAEDFPERFHRAIYSQYAIGWDNFFRGKFSQEWLVLFDEKNPNLNNNNRYTRQYIWGANIIENTLRHVIELWEIRNGQVHGRTSKEREQKRKSRNIQELKKLFEKKNDVRPADIVLFPEDEDEFIEKNTAQGIADYVSMHAKAITNSVNDWKKRSIKGARTILGWLQKDPKNATKIKRTVRRHRDKLIQDSQKRPCRKRKAKNDDFRKYVSVMTKWLKKDPNNKKSIEQVERRRRENFRHEPWNKKKKQKITEDEKDPTQRIIPNYFTLHGKI